MGIAGRARSGKDTAAGLLVAEYGFTRVAFADPLKDALVALDPVVVASNGRTARLRDVLDVFGGWEGVKGHSLWAPVVRALMQDFGDAVRGHVGVDVWRDAAVARVHGVLGSGGRVVVSDVRYPNEFEAVRGLGGVMVRVVRGGVSSVAGASGVGPAAGGPAAGVGHPSECALDDGLVWRADVVVSSDPFETYRERFVSALRVVGGQGWG